MSASHATGAAPRRRRAGPLLLLLPLALLCLGLLHLWRREPLPAPAPPPGVTSPDETVSAWTGEIEGAHGGWLVATLAPLHADPRRQAFEAGSLQRELGLEPGQPWRLSVRWEGPRPASTPGAPATGATGAEASRAGDGPRREEPAGIALAAVRVEDQRGPALTSLPPVEPVSAGQPAVPLRTLVAPPEGSLRPGETADWILWGRAPDAGARLLGLVPEQDEAFRAATGFRGPFPLRATRLRRGDLGQPLARLERLPSGKRAAGQSSELGDEDARGDGR